MPAPSTLQEFAVQREAMRVALEPIVHFFDSQILVQAMASRRPSTGGQLNAIVAAIACAYFDCATRAEIKQTCILAYRSLPEDEKQIDPAANLAPSTTDSMPSAPRQGLSLQGFQTMLQSVIETLFPLVSTVPLRDIAIETAISLTEDAVAAKRSPWQHCTVSVDFSRFYVLYTIIGFLTGVDTTFGKHTLTSLDIMSLFFRKNGQLDRFFEEPDTGAGAYWSPQMRDFVRDNLAIMCNTFGKDESDFQADIDRKKLGELAMEDRAILGMAYVQTAVSDNRIPFFYKFVKAAVVVVPAQFLSGAATGANLNYGHWVVTEEEIEQVALIMHLNPDYTHRQVCEEVNAWANEVGLRPEGAERGYPGFEAMFRTRRDTILARIQELDEQESDEVTFE